MRAGFLCPKCNNFSCLLTRQDQNEFHLKRWFFFAKISMFCKSICCNIFQRCLSVYSTIFVRRKNKTNYLPNQTWFKCYIYTYIIGRYNSSVRIIDLVSHTTYVVCVNFIHKWRDVEFKVDFERLKRWFFFAKIGIFCKSIAGPLHSIVQTYTQPYSFGWRIKLIIG